MVKSNLFVNGTDLSLSLPNICTLPAFSITPSNFRWYTGPHIWEWPWML